MSKHLFSSELSTWLEGSQPKTMDSLSQVFLEKTHAVTLLILLVPSALPLPTGGVTNALEIIAMVVTLQLVVGHGSVWIPKRWESTEIGAFGKEKIIPWTIRLISLAERVPRFSIAKVSSKRSFLALLGIIILVFVVGAFLAPPFSGLDTLPSIGVVLVSLAIIIENGYLLIAGVAAGSAGIALSLSAWDYFLDLLSTL